MKTGQTFQDMRKLSADIEKKRNLEKDRQKSLLMTEKNLLANGAVSKRKTMVKNIEYKQKKSQSNWFYASKPLLICIMFLVVVGIVYTLIFSAGDGKTQNIIVNPKEKVDVSMGSKTYRQVSGYVMNVLNRSHKEELGEQEDIWHENANHEVRFYSGLRLNEMNDTADTNIQKIYQFEGYNCYYCICSNYKENNQDFVVKIAMDNNQLKLVAVE